MFERFTRDARAVVASAVEEAQAMHAREVAPEHLLVALAPRLEALGVDPEALRRDVARADGIDGEALATLGIDLDAVRRRAEDAFGEGALAPTAGGRRPRFGRRAKQALERTLREAVALGDRELRPEHILLALSGDDAAMRLLAGHGLDRDALRAAIVAGVHGP